MKHSSSLLLFILATTIHVMPAKAALRAEDVFGIQMQMQQMSQTTRQGQQLQDSQIVRPTPRERDAITQLLNTKPRPRSLNDADIRYLKELLDKAAWLGFERRIMHEIWSEVRGKQWSEEISPSPNSEEAPQR